MTVADLQPGDHLLYRPRRWWSWGELIAIKTWQPICHIEVYVGDGRSVASRDGIGIDQFDLRTDGLHYVLRPTQPFDLGTALRWFATVRGQAYDWWGLARFVIPRQIPSGNNGQMFCSEFATRLDRAAGFFPFGPLIDADAVAPASYLYSPCFTCSDFAGG